MLNIYYWDYEYIVNNIFENGGKNKIVPHKNQAATVMEVILR